MVRSGFSSHFDGGGIPSTIASVRTNPTDSNVSTRDTIVQMTKLARTYAKHPIVMDAIWQAVEHTNGQDEGEIVTAIFDWVRAHVEFVDDEKVLDEIWGHTPDEAELLIAPPRLLSMDVPQGDCDDQATLLATMLMGAAESIGVEAVSYSSDGLERH